MHNIDMLLRAAGTKGVDLLVELKVYIKDLNEEKYKAFNKAYHEFFLEFDDLALPARTCVGVSYLNFGAEVEISAMAYQPPSLFVYKPLIQR